MRGLKDYRDSFGLIVQRDGDGGDSCNRTMSAYCYMKVLNYETDDLGLQLADGLDDDLFSLSGTAPGRYRRHKDPLHWYSDQDNFSRDQSIVLQAALVLFNFRPHCIALLKQRLKRCLFHFNTHEGDDTPATKKTKLPDPPAPIEVAQFVRCFKRARVLLYPVLLLLDMQLLIDVLVTRPLSRRYGNIDFDVQYLPILLSCTAVAPTPVGLLARHFYSKTAGVKEALRFYFSEDAGRNGLVPLGELACAAYDKAVLHA